MVCIVPVAGGVGTPPAVVSVYPSDGATGVLGNPEIIVTFDEWISDDSADPIVGSFTINDGINDLDFDYDYAFATELKFGNWVGPWLAPNTVYTVTIDGFKDLDGNAMLSPFSSTFTTGPDTAPPTVISTDPQDEEVKVAVDIDAITITFSEPIQYDPEPLTQDNISINKYNGWVEIPFGDITVSGSSLTIPNPGTPDPWFENWEYYYVTVKGVKDLAGNELVDGTSDYYRFHFQTVSTDITAPTVVSTYPSDGDFNVPVDLTITAVMSESINQCAGTVEMVNSTGSPVELEDTCHGGTYYCTDDYLNLRINSTAPLALNETYTVTIRNMVDNYYNVMESWSWSFTTDAPPRVVSTYPSDGASNIPADLTITVVMSESINKCAGTVEMVNNTGSPVGLQDTCHAGTYYCTNDYLNLRINSTAPLVLGETYTVTIRDMEDSNHYVMEPYSWSFTVMTPVETLQDLGTQVDELGLPQDIEDGLMAKLDAAEMQIIEMKYTAAEKILKSFIKQVDSQREKTIDPVIADELVAIAQRIIDAIPG